MSTCRLVAEIRPYIDWSPFFMTPDLKGKHPKILEDHAVGSQVRDVYEDANQLIDEIIADDSLRANAAYAFWPAASDGG
jgi:5-methyltetrahydrofolate--homocysteine methyltransferase